MHKIQLGSPENKSQKNLERKSHTHIFFVQFQIFMANRHHCFVVSQKRCSCYVEWTQLYHTNKMDWWFAIPSNSQVFDCKERFNHCWYDLGNSSFDIMPSNFFPSYAIDLNSFIPLSDHPFISNKIIYSSSVSYPKEKLQMKVVLRQKCHK